MPIKKINNWKQCRSSKDVEKFAMSKSVDIRQGSGSHKIMRYENRTVTYYTGDISTGVAIQIWKFFIKSGLITGLILIFIG